MTNNNDGQKTTGIEPKKERKKYVRSGKFSKKNKVTTFDTESVESESTTEISTSGLTLEFSPKVFQEIQKEEVRRIESEFRNTVLESFEDYITKLKIEIEERGNIPTTVELSSAVGQKSVNYSRELGPNDILTPQSEYTLRCHVGLTLLMESSTRQILNLGRELSQMKSLIRKSKIPVVMLAPTIEPTPVEQTVVTE